MRFLFTTLGAALLALAWAGHGRADDFTYSIATGNAAISGYPGPYVSVDVNLTSSTTAAITFTSLTNSGNIYLMGDGGTVAVNVNATTWTVSGLTSSNAGTGFQDSQIAPDTNPGNEDGWGSFNQTFTSFDGFTHSSDTVSFTLTNTSGTWASAANVLIGNGATPGVVGAVAAHIFVTSSPANASNSALATGFGTDTAGPTPKTPPSVPEPSTLAIAGLGALGLVGFGLRRRRVK
jgi:MYXO-CTERM domain-containing protein